ncbi:MAG: (2Fe-2S)-binding protein [Pseudomonadota bacterium]|nr:(2Fe-2S)-binding protein [Pseudomonadota bacterium]
MIVCSCNVISEREIRQVIKDLLREDAWRLIVPLQVYHAMQKRGKCCGCFPRVVDLIVETTESFHRELNTPGCEIVSFLDRLRDRHRECETVRIIARKRMERMRAA